MGTINAGACCCGPPTINLCGIAPTPATKFLTVRTWGGGTTCTGPTSCAIFGSSLCQCYNLFAWLATHSIQKVASGTGSPTTTWQFIAPFVDEGGGHNCSLVVNVTAHCQTYTGTLTSGSPVVTGMSPTTAGMVLGAPVSGANIPAGATVLSIDSSTQITLSANATATGTSSTALDSLWFDYGGGYTSATGVGISLNGAVSKTCEPTSTWSPFHLTFYSAYDQTYGLGCYTITD